MSSRAFHLLLNGPFGDRVTSLSARTSLSSAADLYRFGSLILRRRKAVAAALRDDVGLVPQVAPPSSENFASGSRPGSVVAAYAPLPRESTADLEDLSEGFVDAPDGAIAGA